MTAPRTVSVCLPSRLVAAVEDLALRIGLPEETVLRHLLGSGAFWAGVFGPGEDSFHYLLNSVFGETEAGRLRHELLTAAATDMEFSHAIAKLDAEEVRRAFPHDWPEVTA